MLNDARTLWFMVCLHYYHPNKIVIIFLQYPLCFAAASTTVALYLLPTDLCKKSLQNLNINNKYTEFNDLLAYFLF